MSGTVGQRLRAAREAARMSVPIVQERLQIPSQLLAAWECSDTAEGAAPYLPEFARLYAVSAEWLRTGEGPMREGETS